MVLRQQPILDETRNVRTLESVLFWKLHSFETFEFLTVIKCPLGQPERTSRLRLESRERKC